MIQIYQKKIKDEAIKILDKFQVGSWVYVESPTSEELDSLAGDFGLERDLLEDAKDPYEVPREEIEKNNIYIFTRLPHKEENDVITTPMLFILGKDFLMTICERRPMFLEKFLNGELEFTTTQKTKLFVQIFRQIDTIYTRVLTSIGKQVRAKYTHLINIENKDILQLISFEGILNDFLAALIPTNGILKNILSGKILKLYKEDEDLVEDLFLASGQLIEICKSHLKTLVNLREGYSTIVTNNLNRVIKFLTALTIIFSVPTMIASFFGMNVAMPLSADAFLSFWQIVIGAITMSILLLIIFIKKNWV